ncbi:MAG: hypothetical protein JXR83_14470 [Deltaproteobacteria bacterium]|nr:hypothetical protein [Deltaproteobacteria bacterium]
MKPWHPPTLVLLLLALALTGCGEPSLIVLQVSGDLSVPDEINTLGIAMLSDPDHDDLNHFALNLRQEGTLPISVSLEPSDTTPTKLIVDVTAALDSQSIAHVEHKFTWIRDQINEVKLPPLERY